MPKHFTPLLLCFSIACHLVNAQSGSSMPTATIQNGTIIGTTTMLPAATAPVNKFLGVPFAQSPPQRFGPPQPADAFDGTLMAQTYSPACIQQFVYPAAVQNFTEAVFNYPPPPAGESEDCLYLNIFAPSSSPPKGGWAVMFWIYGGALQFGTATLATYDGSAFAAYSDVVLVTFNYRTNVFGFAGSSELPTTERNLGFLDQRMALQWVQDNIGAFGGDPSKVTIFGESAGAFSVDALITSFDTQSAPFRAAIMESGQVSYQAFNQSRTNNDAEFQRLASLANCTGDALTCLRAVPATTIQTIIEQNSIIFPSVEDNYTYFSNRALRRASGQFAQVPTLLGTNANEGRIFELGQTNLTAFVQGLIGSIDPSIVPQVLQAFPTNSTVSGYDQISNIFTLLIFQCGAAYQALQTSTFGIPTWRYLYNATFPNLSPLNGLLEVYHSSEIPLVFQTYPGGPVNPVANDTSTVQPLYLPPTAEQYALGHYMTSAWTTFAKNPLYGPGWWKVGFYGGKELGILGGSLGTVAGVEVVNSGAVDAQCDIFKPLFQTVAGLSLPELGS